MNECCRQTLIKAAQDLVAALPDAPICHTCGHDGQLRKARYTDVLVCEDVQACFARWREGRVPAPGAYGKADMPSAPDKYAYLDTKKESDG